MHKRRTKFRVVEPRTIFIQKCSFFVLLIGIFLSLNVENVALVDFPVKTEIYRNK
ncbi:MAG: hypothetical protein CFH10_00478 [Alphaproteobacteria bacterium MarineAlpha4_Bin2]|nr:MAG: hypothetical protein CFH10_00478 [Alphaproteobacteria bacterium MarineAlpha4_Bin2]